MVNIMMKALHDFRRSIVRSLKDRKEEKKNSQIWSEAKRYQQVYRERIFARDAEGIETRVFEPVKFLTFSQMLETNDGALKKGSIIYLAAHKIESVRPHRGNFDDDHTVIICGGVEYIVYGDYGYLLEVLEDGIDTRSEETRRFCL